MFKKLDKKVKLDVKITIIATSVSILFILASYILETHAAKILSLLVIILPTIYIVGNLIIRGLMEKELKEIRKGYDKTIQEINESSKAIIVSSGAAMSSMVPSRIVKGISISS